MRIFKKIALIWCIATAVGSLCLLWLPNSSPSLFSLTSDALMFLIACTCLALFLKDPISSNKPIFLNFSAFFLLSIVSFAYKFAGFAFFVGNQWKTFYLFQYHLLAYFFLLAFAVVYVVVDSLFNDFKTHRKYIISLLIAGGTFAFYYYPYFQNPNYLKTCEEIVDCRAISSSMKQLAAMNVTNPSAKEIAAISDLGVWRDGMQIGSLYDDQKVRRVTELLPYLEGDNIYVLLYKPLYMSNIYMNVLCVVFVFLFFGYQYKNDPPQGAYIEKIIFLFLPYCSLEILHHYAYIKSVEYSTFEDVQQIGIYLSLVNMVLLLVFFSLRLRFITSVKGEFYERELVSDAEHISRWRDAFDNLVVRHFLNPKAVHGRLFASRSPRGEA